MTSSTNLVDTTALVTLEWTTNLEDWEECLWVALDVHNLTDYVFNPDAKPEPNKDEEPDKYETWRFHRAVVVAAIYSTL